MMSKETVQFIEIARTIAKPVQDYPMDCRLCGRMTAHVFLNDRGIYERYQCRMCGMIRQVAVR